MQELLSHKILMEHYFSFEKRIRENFEDKNELDCIFEELKEFVASLTIRACE